MTQPSLPQGTRDFAPETVRKRNYIFNTIREVFELHGFQPLETPAMENLDTLLGKYGDEGNKLIFKVLNNGLEHPGKREKAKQEFEKILEGKNSKEITERALKYDLTIPFARFVAMNHGQLTYPFKRYQIQPVWRADRPARGRYREFYQCDADVVGSNSLLNEVELAAMYAAVFDRLRIPVEVKINSRNILMALAAKVGGDKLTDITVAIDKLDKIGLDKVKDELGARGLNETQLGLITQYLAIGGSNEEKLAQAGQLLGQGADARKGIEEIETLLSFAGAATPLIVDLTLARGLNYYTGIIFEVKAKNIQMGSIGGGGRYDDLTGLFGVPDVPGVGISFGVDRIYDVMEELGLFPPEVHTGTQILFFNLGQQESRLAFETAQVLRGKGLRCEVFHEAAKFEKQFKYADKKKIPFVVIIGEEEMRAGRCQVKNIESGKQVELALKDLGNYTFR